MIMGFLVFVTALLSTRVRLRFVSDRRLSSGQVGQAACHSLRRLRRAAFQATLVGVGVCLAPCAPRHSLQAISKLWLSISVVRPLAVSVCEPRFPELCRGCGSGATPAVVRHLTARAMPGGAVQLVSFTQRSLPQGPQPSPPS